MHHAFHFSSTEFLRQVEPCWSGAQPDLDCLHKAAERAIAAPSASQLELLELIRFEPSWWLARGKDEEPFRWLVLILSGLPSLRRAPSLSEPLQSGFLSLRDALAGLGWHQDDIQRLLTGRTLDHLLTISGLPSAGPVANGLQLMPGFIAPDEAAAMLRHLTATPLPSGMDDSAITMLRSAIQFDEHLLLGLFD